METEWSTDQLREIHLLVTASLVRRGLPVDQAVERGANIAQMCAGARLGEGPSQAGVLGALGVLRDRGCVRSDLELCVVAVIVFDTLCSYARGLTLRSAAGERTASPPRLAYFSHAVSQGVPADVAGAILNGKPASAGVIH